MKAAIEEAPMRKNYNGKGRRIKGRFLALPYDVLRSTAYKSLSPYAVKLLVDIGAQFNGSNNGDLNACFSEMKEVGWRSSATLQRAKSELLSAGLIEQTRQGGMNAGPNLYALTWRRIDECTDKYGNPKHDAPPTTTGSGLWKHAPTQH